MGEQERPPAITGTGVALATERAPTPQDTLSRVVPGQLIETARLVCEAGAQVPELAAVAVEQVAAIEVKKN